MAHDREILFQHREQIFLRAALEHFAQERAAGRQNINRKRCGLLGEAHDTQVVGAGVSNRGCCHIRHNDIGTAIAQFRLEQRLGARVGKIQFQNIDAGDRLDTEIVDGDHLAFAFQ